MSAQPPAQPDRSEAGGERETASRLLALLLAASLVFVAVVMARQAIEFAGLPLQEDVTQLDEEYYDGSGLQRDAATALFAASAVAALIAATFAVLMATAARFSRFVMPSVAVAVALGAGGIVVNAV